MNCRYCGAEIAAGAVFCINCGRVVAGDGTPRTSPNASSRLDAPRPDAGPTSEVERCPQCGDAIAESDVFCRRCGFVVHTPPVAGGSDTAIVAPGGSRPALPLDSPYDPVYPTLPPHEVSVPRPAGRPLDAAAADAAQGILPSAGVPLRRRDRFVLQFSTGESVITAGSGLIGRNPQAEPGERVDQLVVVGDAGKSVSKTHLEFGQEDGEFWVCDRWSTNGTILRAPEAEGRRAQAGHRYRVPRGTRIEIGDQFFVVS